MSSAEIIGSTNLIILLEDEIFADFFNTFLSLPVFGQTPFYTVENSQWSLWPEIPCNLELISFIKSPEGAKMMRWKKADQWLLQKCIGGVRGMWRFYSYLTGSAGEELVDFWILAEKILSIDEMDLEVRDYYLSLLLMLRATHLQEGSRVVTLCNMNIKSLLNISIWHPNQSTTRREILSHMQKVALFKLQSYWLPNFYTHTKTTVDKEESCHSLMEEYETRLYSMCYTHVGGLPLNMSIKKCHHFQKRYSSRKAKRKMWQLVDPDSWSLEMDLKPDAIGMPLQETCPQEKVVIQMPSLKMASSKETRISSLEKEMHYAKKSSMKNKAKSHLHMEGLFETKISTHLRTVTPIVNHSSKMTIQKAIRQSFSLGYIHLALCADACAGNPFRNYLKKLNLKVEIQLLDLWQDLQHFLSVLVNNKKNGNAIFRHLLGDRICELYLNEQIGPCLPLKSQTIQGLKKLLPSGDVIPWIPKAQKEICKMLSPWYDEFLDEEDYWFLLFTTQNRFISSRQRTREFIGKEENILLYKRIQQSLELSQALADMKEMDYMQWRKIATEDLKQGGSLQVELTSPVFLTDITKMSFEELCYKNPKMAIQKISDDYKIYCEKAPKIGLQPGAWNRVWDKKDFKMEIIKEPKTVSRSNRKMSLLKRTLVRKPSMRPRNLIEVLLNTQHLEFFREFLKERKAESPLQFLIAVQKISIETNEKICKSLIETVIKTFFQGRLSPEEILQCDAPIIKEIASMHHVTTSTLLTLQGHIMKSIEEKWFKDYQDLFPPRPQEVEVQSEVQMSSRKPSKIVSTYLQESQKKGWLRMISFIRSFCKYRRFMLNPSKRQEFEDYLHQEMQNSKENFTTPYNTSGRSAPPSTNVRSADQENGEITLVKRRIFGHRIITVNFAINDLYFFSEMEKFNDLVSSAHMLQINRAYNENDVILMRSKMNIIQKLFLNSDIPPKLRVNVPESQKDAILAAITDGYLDRSIFHGAIMSVFPVVMYFWKRFCFWKVTRSYLQYKGKKFKDRKSPPKSMDKYPFSSGGDNAILRFTLLRGIEWLQPQQEAISSVQNSSSSNLTQPRLVVSAMQLYPVHGVCLSLEDVFTFIFYMALLILKFFYDLM
ncbi:regulator of G-protein signaling protein-like isoform X6 [Symphalangus syndactylus]|uniref:regulator of G-protein signaling protein-like isoform X6 n=1 Tax=Symphalangus syndactylus TaxID=9590 RepID=UPI002441F027|nr:regulator of G-protein signaling protein-like isoform X5 [Symphalangus syndactylus]